ADRGLRTADYAAEERIATRSSTRTDAESADFRRKRTQAPSATPGGTDTRTACGTVAWPLPPQRWHRSVHDSPRPPQCGHVMRTESVTGTTRPSNASR